MGRRVARSSVRPVKVAGSAARSRSPQIVKSVAPAIVAITATDG